MDEDWSERLAADWTEVMASCWMTSALGEGPQSLKRNSSDQVGGLA
jgi:hypothetical protein